MHTVRSFVHFQKRFNQLVEQGVLSTKYQTILLHFFSSYAEAVIEGSAHNLEQIDTLFSTYLDLIAQQICSPFPFQPYHKQIRHPFDYYQFGMDLFYPLIDQGSSSLQGREHLDKIASDLASGDNVIFFANHQIEADPVAISVLLEKDYKQIAQNMIFVAGERVLTDPLAVPLSMGCNLLCIYSKRYSDTPPEEKLRKQLHNKRTMEKMSSLLEEGGRCIYVAPSGGRDRPNAAGRVEVAPFDPQSIEMFYLMAKKSKKPCRFFPMALVTHHLLPPPETIQTELGERRHTRRGAIHLKIGPEIPMDRMVGLSGDKHEQRRIRAEAIWKQVVFDYNDLIENLSSHKAVD